MDTVKVYVTPGHAPDMRPPLLEEMTRGKPDIIFPSEFYRLAGEKVPGYHTIGVRSPVNSRGLPNSPLHSPLGDAGDNPVLVSTEHVVTHREAKKLSEYLPNSPEHGKYGPERWGYAVDIDWAAGLRLISAHPQPFGVSRPAWVREMRWVRRQIIDAEEHGLAVILAGDLQTAGRLVPLMLRGLDMRTWRVGICWLAWWGLREVPGHRRQTRPQGMDHSWFGLNLARIPHAQVAP